MKLDTAKNGINAVWKSYEDESIKFLLERGEEGAGSGAVFSHVLFVLNSVGKTISRASVIFFLNRLVDDRLATYTERTGKGGWHRVYSLIDKTAEAFNQSVIDKFIYKLGEIYPDNDRIKAINEVS